MIVSSDNNWRGSFPVDWVSVWPGHWPWENDENLQISVKSCHQITPCPLQYSICPAPCVVSMSPIILGNQHHQILIIGTGLEAKIWTNVYSIHNGQFASAGARWCNIFVTNVFAKSGLILMLTMARCRAWPRSDRISREITKPLATEAAGPGVPTPGPRTPRLTNNFCTAVWAGQTISRLWPSDMTTQCIISAGLTAASISVKMLSFLSPPLLSHW